MPQAQSGICAEAKLHGMYLLLNVLDGHDDFIATKLIKIIELQEEFADQFSEALLSCVVAVGAEYWPHLSPDKLPLGLTGFPQLDAPDYVMPSQPYDLFIQIRSDRSDVNHLFGLRVLHILSPDVELVEQIKCFRFLDGRDFNGFIYGADLPHGKGKRKAALIEAQDPEFHLGSFVNIQRFRHNLNKWQQLSIEDQEYIMGRTRLDNQLVANISPNSHALCVELKDFSGHPIMLEQGMPYGDMNEQGMFSVCYSGDAKAFKRLLESRLGDGVQYDHWLDYCTADMGATFFAPSIDFLKQLAQRQL
jgi:putative iron-dependent peroxidase